MKARVIRPEGRPLEIGGRTIRTALAGVHVHPSTYARHVLLFVEGASAPALVSRGEYVEALRGSYPTLASLLEDEPVRPGWVLTVRLARSLSPSTAVVGALRVVASETPRWTR